MNKIDLIIDALENWQHSCLELGRCSSELGLATKALAAARELKDELYAKEMEQPMPKQSGKMSITALRFDEVTK